MFFEGCFEDGDIVICIFLEFFLFFVNEDSVIVSYVIQLELFILLKFVVRIDLSGDLEKLEFDVNELELILNNVLNLKQRIFKIEEFYVKDTKILNINVLLEDFEKDDLVIDLEKFFKQELNIFVENDLVMYVFVESVVVVNNKDDIVRKGLKNINI